MGHRANLLLVEGDRHRLFYSHWCAITLPVDLFWGPDHALRFITMQREVGPDEWLDEVWAEGGALLDPNRRLLLAFGGEEIGLDVPLRRTWLALMRQTWPGWEVRWASEGIAELANHVGHPRQDVLCKESFDSDGETLDPPEEFDWTSSVAGVAFAGGELRFFPLGLISGELVLFNGPALLDDARRLGGHAQLSLVELGAGFPTSGLHIDESARTIDLWTASDAAELDLRVARHWPGFAVRWHRDRFESQLERSEGRLSFPERSQAEQLDRLRAILLAEERTEHPLSGLLTHLASRGEEVQVNEHALRDDRLPLPAGDRSSRFEQAVRAAFGPPG